MFVFLDISDTFDELRYDLDQNLKVVDVRIEENETDENKTNLNANLKKFIKTNFISLYCGFTILVIAVCAEWQVLSLYCLHVSIFGCHHHTIPTFFTGQSVVTLID